MDVKIFILGRPGSGSSPRSYIEQSVRHRMKGCHIFRVCDYDILYQMFVDDVRHEMFCSIDHGGFDVHNLNAFDIALKTLESSVEQWIKEELISPNHL